MITCNGTNYIIPGAWSFRAKPAPDRKYIPARRYWELPNHAANRRFLLGNFTQRDFEPAAWDAVNEPESLIVASDAPRPVWPSKVKNHLTGEWFDVLPHQLEALDRAWGLKGFALFHGMGSGKTLTMLLLWDAMFKAGLIDEAWAIPPNSIIDNWREQVQMWTPWNADKIKVYGVLSLSAGNLPKELVTKAHARLAVASDESQRIKNSKATRTKIMTQIGNNAGFTYIMTGTSITKGIEDLYSQYAFIDPMITGHKSFYSFRNRYCVMGGFEGRQIVGYREVKELMELLAPYTHVVENAVQLPPMAHEDRRVKLSPEQRRLLKELKDMMETEMSGTKLTVENALTYYTRGAQIIGGFFPIKNADGTSGVMALPNNPKLDELLEIMESTPKKVVVFCRFVAEANLVLRALEKYNPAAVLRGTPDIQAESNRFQSNDSCRVMVSTYSMGSIGHTWTAGKILIKYSGTFNYEDEAQSEKRIDRIGQNEPTLTIRLMADSKLESAMKATAQGKKSIATFVSQSLHDPRTLASLLDTE